MWNWIMNDLFQDGYSKWFALAFVVSCLPFVWDVLRNGWSISEGGDTE